MINNYTISSTEKFQISDINFNKDGLVPVISQCVHTGVILMMAWMNKEALKKTIKKTPEIILKLFIIFF